MKVLKTILVNHTKKEPEYAETRFYVTELDDVAKGDVFSVWAHGKLTYAKVKQVMEKHEYLSTENGGTMREDLPIAMNRIDTTTYQINKKAQSELKRLNACLQERIIEGKYQAAIDATIKALTGEAKDEVKAILAKIKGIETDPCSVLAD